MNHAGRLAETRSGLRTSVITDAAQLAIVHGPWRALWLRCPKATLFQSPDWLVPWWDIFAPGELRVIAVHSGEELIGLAPLYREAARACLLPIGTLFSDYQDILLDPGETSRAAHAIAIAIDDMDDVERCEFDELASGAQALQLGPLGWEERLATASPCPVLALPDNLRGLASGIPPSRLRHLRTARRRVARRGDSAIIEGDADNAAALLAELVRLHGLRLRAHGQKGVFADPRVEAFHAAALPSLIEQGVARLYALTIGDAIAGVYYGFGHRDRAYSYLAGNDPAFAFESPGSVLLGHAIEGAVREGMSSFDFLRGSDDYKYEWGAKDRWNVRMTLSRTGRLHA